jgi:hypothetical protein
MTPTGQQTSPPLIPDPQTIRERLYSLRTEARLLARLLRVAEESAKVLPDRRQAEAASA